MLVFKWWDDITDVLKVKWFSFQPLETTTVYFSVYSSLKSVESSRTEGGFVTTAERLDSLTGCPDQDGCLVRYNWTILHSTTPYILSCTVSTRPISSQISATVGAASAPAWAPPSGLRVGRSPQLPSWRHSVPVCPGWGWLTLPSRASCHLIIIEWRQAFDKKTMTIIALAKTFFQKNTYIRVCTWGWGGAACVCTCVLISWCKSAGERESIGVVLQLRFCD